MRRALGEYRGLVVRLAVPLSRAGFGFGCVASRFVEIRLRSAGCGAPLPMGSERFVGYCGSDFGTKWDTITCTDMAVLASAVVCIAVGDIALYWLL